MGMYESPIKIIESTIDSIYKDIVKKKDDAIFAEIQYSFGVDLDRKELLRALQYDRNQYEKGYMDGKAAAMAELVRCKDCKHPKLPAVLTQKYGEPGTLTCHNWHSPCNKRNVKQDDFCSYGERKDNE